MGGTAVYALMVATAFDAKRTTAYADETNRQAVETGINRPITAVSSLTQQHCALPNTSPAFDSALAFGLNPRPLPGTWALAPRPVRRLCVRILDLPEQQQSIMHNR